jgi:5-methylcytosine-specific restriction protein A
MFKKNKSYIRKKLHDKYGGNRQSGISKSKKHNIIMLFTGNKGKKYGYNDGWKGEFFYYYGEGQVGDMEFKRGNKAIKNHILDNYELHLFKNISNGYVKYMGKFVYEGYEIDEGYDTKGNLRKIIVFKLIPYEKYQNRL